MAAAGCGLGDFHHVDVAAAVDMDDTPRSIGPAVVRFMLMDLLARRRLLRVGLVDLQTLLKHALRNKY